MTQPPRRRSEGEPAPLYCDRTIESPAADEVADHKAGAGPKRGPAPRLVLIIASNRVAIVPRGQVAERGPIDGVLNGLDRTVTKDELAHARMPAPKLVRAIELGLGRAPGD